MGKLNHAWVKMALEQADNERSQISERERELHGLSSIRLKCLINNLCAAEKMNYLEIGTYNKSPRPNEIIDFKFFLINER